MGREGDTSICGRMEDPEAMTRGVVECSWRGEEETAGGADKEGGDLGAEIRRGPEETGGGGDASTICPAEGILTADASIPVVFRLCAQMTERYA